MSEQEAKPTGTEIVQRILDREIEGFTPERIALIRRTIAPEGTTADELTMFLSFCQARDLNPLLKQVYLMRNKGRISIITGVDGLRLLAQRSGEYEGQVGPEWKATADGEWDDVPPEDSLYAARVGIWRTGFKTPLWGTVRLKDFDRSHEAGATNWQQRPAHMLAIRAETHALRRAFPAETSGVTVSYEGGVEVPVSITSGGEGGLTYPQLGTLHKLAKRAGWTKAERLRRAGVKSFNDLTKQEASDLIDEWTNELESPQAGPGDTVASAAVVDQNPAPSAAPVAAEENDPEGSPLPHSSAAANVEEAPGDTLGDPPANASSSNVRGRAASKSLGKAPKAPRPADTSGGSGAHPRPAPGSPPDTPVARDPTGSGASGSNAPQPPSENSGEVPEAPATSLPRHRFEGDGLVCTYPDCEYLEENPVHR